MTKHNLAYIFFISGIASLGAVILGYDASVISGVIDPLTEYLDLTPAESGWAVSNVILGCVFGAWVAGYISDRIGRKMTLIITTILFVISAIGSALVSTLWAFVIYRMIAGLAIGLGSATTPLYIAEISPKGLRGRTLGLQQLLLVFGQIAVFVVNYIIARGMSHEWIVNDGWRWMLASGAVPCIFFIALVGFMPESPRWYAMRGEMEKARRGLLRFSNERYVDQILSDIQHGEQAEALKQKQQINRDRQGIIKDKKSRYILIVGCAVALLQQVIGINILMYYAPSLLQNINNNVEVSLFQSIFLSSANFIGIAICLTIVDRVGRTPLMRWGALGCGICLLFSSWAFISGVGGLLPVIGLFMFVLIFGLTWSLNAWLLISEIFPSRMRAVGMGFAFCSMYVANFVVTQSFPMMNRSVVLMHYFNGAFPLILCTIFCLISFWFVKRFLPETRGVSLEQIEPVMLSKSRRFGNKQPIQGIAAPLSQ